MNPHANNCPRLTGYPCTCGATARESAVSSAAFATTATKVAAKHYPPHLQTDALILGLTRLVLDEMARSEPEKTA